MTTDHQTLSLPERVKHESLVLAHDFALGRAHRAGVGWQVGAQEFPERPFADETDSRAVFLVVDGQSAIPGYLPDFTLDEFAERKHRFGQRFSADCMQEIALILARVFALEKSAMAIDDARPRVVPRGEKIATEAFGVIAEHAELDLAIAEYVGVGCATFAVFVEEVLEHLVAILLGEIRV